MAIEQREMKEAKWQAFYARPETQEFLETLEEDVRQTTIQEGHIVEWKPGESLDPLLQS